MFYLLKPKSEVQTSRISICLRQKKITGHAPYKRRAKAIGFLGSRESIKNLQKFKGF